MNSPVAVSAKIGIRRRMLSVLLVLDVQEKNTNRGIEVQNFV